MHCVDAELVFQFNRPMLDLGPYNAHGPFLNEGVELARLAFVEDTEYPRVHGGLLRSTRQRIAAAAGRSQCVVAHPADLAVPDRTSSWELLCACCDETDALMEPRRSNLLWLLYRLTFFELAVSFAKQLLPSAGKAERPFLLCIIGLCNYAMSVDGSAHLDTAPFADAYAEATPGSWASVEASYFLSQTNARTVGDVNSLQHWLSRHRQAVETAEVDEHDRAKLWSRYYRIHALLPQLEGRHEEMVQDMDLAEHWLAEMSSATMPHRAELRALRYACNESRIKEALVTGDVALAEERARRAIAFEPNDGRLFLHLGQVLIETGDIAAAVHAYSTAALLTPWGAEVALFMMGQCYEAMEEYWPALHCYRSSATIDPLSVSARDAAIRLAAALGMDEEGAAAPSKDSAGPGVDGPRAAKHQRYAGALGE